MKIFRSKKSILILSAILVVIPGLVYLASQGSNSGKNNLDSIISNVFPNLNKKNETNTVFGDDLKNLVDKIGKIIELPSNEVPNIATVTDINRLKDQAFFANAQNGDKVLLYTKAKRAIIYRPSKNIIIEATSSIDIKLNDDLAVSATESGIMQDASGSAEQKILKENK